MDNLKYYNDSLAYDFNMFMPAEKRVRQPENNVITMPKTAARKKARSRAATRTVSVSAFAVMTCVLILSALCGNIFLRLRINEVDNKINGIKSQISELDSEKTGLEVELERKISYSNIEVEAAQLGMQKMDKNQVRYIRVNDKDAALTSKGETVSAENNQ